MNKKLTVMIVTAAMAGLAFARPGGHHGGPRFHHAPRHHHVPHHHHHVEEVHCTHEHESGNICFIEIDEALLRIGVGSENQHSTDSDLGDFHSDSSDLFFAEVAPLWSENDEGVPFLFPPRLSLVALLCHGGALALRAPPSWRA